MPGHHPSGFHCYDGADVVRNTTIPHLPRITSDWIFELPSNPLNLNPQRMLLNLSHQQDFGLLLFGDLKGIGTGDAFTLRMDGQGQGQSI